MTTAMKKLINDPNAVARESIEGLALAFPHVLRKLDRWQAVVRRDAPIAGKAAILTGGGSGHEPMFAGFVGPGLADGSVAGNVFASPPPPPIVATAKAIAGEKGVLFLYGNYAGDVLNFDAAAEELQADGIAVSTVRITDDVTSAPPERRHERRGIAGDLFVIKVAGAAAAEGGDLAAVTGAAQKANAHTRSMGVALSSCTIPASGKPIFDLGERDMEIGMGLHGEPGIHRGQLETADTVAEMLVGRILADMPLPRGSEVGVLVNGFGATPLAELLILFRAVRHLLGKGGVGIARAFVGNYASSIDMAGGSVTLIRLDAELKRWLLAPCSSAALTQV
jgi:dihydroxyacetone kinase